MPTLEAGRELDALVAEKIFGWQRRPFECNAEQRVVVPPDWTDFSVDYWLGRDIYEHVPAYSTDIAAAWQVVERLRDLGCNHFSLEWEQPYDDRPRRDREADPQERPWLFAFNAPRHLSGSPSIGMPDPVVLHASTAPLAICYGALIAVGAAYP
jgi:hypothetical protein